MVGVVDDGCCCCWEVCWGGFVAVVVFGGGVLVVGCVVDEGMNEMESVPEKRTTLTARATGKMAVPGRG